VEWRRPVRSSLALFRSRWYVIGIVVATGSWGLHVAALSLAPISLVQSVIAGGLCLLTVVADRMFGFRVTRREWIGVACTAAGLAFLAATLEGTADRDHSDYDSAGLAVYLTLLVAAGVAVPVLSRASSFVGPLLGASAGIIWGASDVAIKALSNELGDGLLVLADPLALFIALASFAGLVVSAKSLQLGEAVAVIAVTSAAANACTILSGPLIFGEPLPDDPIGLAVRGLAFALVIAATALTPAPVRALPA